MAHRIRRQADGRHVRVGGAGAAPGPVSSHDHSSGSVDAYCDMIKAAIINDFKTRVPMSGVSYEVEAAIGAMSVVLLEKRLRTHASRRRKFGPDGKSPLDRRLRLDRR